jgi:predicted ribosomally synthesized peptide with SipW-like signal peptide
MDPPCGSSRQSLSPDVGAHSRRPVARRDRSRLRRIRAVLAGALVLGIGGSVTLASWTDTEYASGSFTASRFSLESTVSSPYSVAGPWTVNETAPGATLAFNATGLYPGSTVYAPIALRTQTGSTAGTTSLGAAAVTGTGPAPLLGAALVYRAVRADTCDASAFVAGATFLVGSDTVRQPLTTGQAAAASTVLPAATATGPGPSVRFCFEVALPAGASNLLQGKAATAVWQFSATSTP